MSMKQEPELNRLVTSNIKTVFSNPQDPDYFRMNVFNHHPNDPIKCYKYCTGKCKSKDPETMRRSTEKEFMGYRNNVLHQNASTYAAGNATNRHGNAYPTSHGYPRGSSDSRTGAYPQRVNYSQQANYSRTGAGYGNGYGQSGCYAQPGTRKIPVNYGWPGASGYEHACSNMYGSGYGGGYGGG
ncbi:hypothetical protein NA57DRAFT_59636 [Rhizodiscina lignyota]|uniref:Uncharacterized protein n=1 Tax=Rhizodiscina lignyota TaxID=1504668 RepID=A0A9P4M3F3_9PEZI|nr:hypothetical protein NA57DRAFT_59636 [Rhizodiscina lignyota]